MSGVYWIDGPWRGKLAIVARPRGEDWLSDDVAMWQRNKIAVVVSLLTRAENQELGLLTEGRHVISHGMQFRSFPVADRSVPTSMQQIQLFIEELDDLLVQGYNVAVHCRHGVGRSALLVASLLAHKGVSPAQAFVHITRQRGCPVPDTPGQREWVERYAASVQAQRIVPVGEESSVLHEAVV